MPDSEPGVPVESPVRGPKLNVLIVSSSLWIGGAETVIAHLARMIDRRQFNVTVCYLKERGHIGDELVRSGIDVVGAQDASGPRFKYLSYKALLRVIQAKEIDIVHTHNVDGLADAAICKLLTPSVRFVHTFHFGNYPTRPWFLVRSSPTIRHRLMWMERTFATFADSLFAVGEVQRRQILALYRFRKAAVRTIWNGVPLPCGTADRTLRSRVGGDGRILVGTIATMIEQKGLREFLHVAKRVHAAVGDQVRFVLVGEGKLRIELERLRHELGLDEAVTFTGWITNAADVALPAFDIFFQPSRWEAMSVVILEAMARAKPVVATRVGENPNVIEDNVDGLLVPPGDVGAMSEALLRVIRDADLRVRLGGAAKRKVEQRFTVQHMARAYEAAYVAAIQGRAS